LDLVPDLRLSRSWTTRPRRPGEAADAYVFVTQDDFQRRIREHGFLEWTESASSPGNLYGTPALNPDDRGDDVILEIDLDGARQVKEVHPDAVLILVLAPSRDAQEKRLRDRGDTDDDVAHRMVLGAEEERVGRQMADHVVFNDEIERAVTELAGIIQAHRKGH
jgi:guanylate kinase